MITKRSLTRLFGIAGALLIAASSPDVWAVASGTQVDNAATVNYKVATVDQDAITSSTYTFTVDKKVDLTVAEANGAAVTITPNLTTAALKFTVTNDGNDVQDFRLSSTAVATSGATKWDGATDAFDGTALLYYDDSGGTPGSFDGTDAAITYIDELAAGASETVFVVVTIPGSVTNGQYSSYHLIATARAGGGASSEGAALTATGDGTADTVDDGGGAPDIVFADAAGSDDGARDASHSAQHDYKVATSNLSITKSSTVISDGVSASNFKRIPGAVVEYLLTVSNGAGASSATNISISDSLNTEIATDGDIAFNTQYDATAGQGIKISHPDYSAGADTEYTNADDGVVNSISVDWNVTTTNAVTVTGITLDAGESATVKFRVTIQ